MTVAAVAAFAIAAPASASEIRIPVAGKSVAQLDAEIAAAARRVCKADTYDKHAYVACYRVSLQNAKAQLSQMAAAEGQQFAQR